MIANPNPVAVNGAVTLSATLSDTGFSNRAAAPVRRKISECIAMLPADSTATVDPDFAKDVDAAVAAHQEALEPPEWD